MAKCRNRFPSVRDTANFIFGPPHFTDSRDTGAPGFFQPPNFNHRGRHNGVGGRSPVATVGARYNLAADEVSMSCLLETLQAP